MRASGGGGGSKKKVKATGPAGPRGNTPSAGPSPKVRVKTRGGVAVNAAPPKIAKGKIKVVPVRVKTRGGMSVNTKPRVVGPIPAGVERTAIYRDKSLTTSKTNASRAKMQVAGINTGLTAKKQKEIAGKVAAPALKTIEQLNRVASAEGEGAYQAIQKFKKTGNPAVAGVAGVKGAAKGFKQNKSGWAKFYGKGLGLPGGVAATLGYISDVGFDPQTYVTGGAAPAARAAVQRGGEKALRKALSSGLDKAAVKASEKRAASETVKQQARAKASAEAIKANEQRAATALDTQRQNLDKAAQRAERRGDTEKAAKLRERRDAVGKRSQVRVAKKEKQATEVVKPASKKQVKAAVRSEWRAAGEKKAALSSDLPERGRTISVGIGGKQARVTIRRGFKEDLTNTKAKEAVRSWGAQVNPRIRTDVTLPSRSFDAALAANRSRRGMEAYASHRSQATINALVKMFPDMSERAALKAEKKGNAAAAAEIRKRREAWVKAFESNDISHAPEGYVVDGKLKGAADVQRILDSSRKKVIQSGQAVGDVTQIRVPNPAKTKAELDAAKAAEREASKATRSAKKRLGKAKTDVAVGTARTRQISVADRALVKAILPKNHPMRVAMRELSQASKELNASGKGLRNRARRPNAELFGPSERVGGLPRRLDAKQRYQAAKDNYDREMEKLVKHADWLYGLGKRDGLAMLGRHGQASDLKALDDAAARVAGTQAEVKAAKKAEYEAKQAHRLARGAHERELKKAQKVKPLKHSEDQAQRYYPHNLTLEDQIREARYGDKRLGPVVVRSHRPGSIAQRRSDVRRIDVQNPAREAYGEPKFSTNPVGDVANYERDALTSVARNRAAAKLADSGDHVRFDRTYVNGNGKRITERLTEQQFRLRYGLNNDRKMYFLGSRGEGAGTYGLHEVSPDEIKKILKGEEKPQNGRYVVLDRRAKYEAEKGPSGKPADVPGLTAYDKISAGFKRVAIATPMYHMINHIGDTWIMYTVLPAKDIPAYQAKSLKVLRYLQAEEAGRASKGKVLKGINELGAEKIAVGGQEMTVAQFAKELVGEGAARQGYYSRLEDIQHYAENGIKGQRLNKVARGWRSYSRTLRSREDMNRIGTYWYLRDQGKGTQQAADEMLNALIDYGELSTAERNFFRRVALFYTFPARQIPYQTKALFRKPGKFAAYEKFRRNVAYAYNIPPDSLQNEPYFKQAGLGVAIRTKPGPFGVPLPSTDGKGEVRYVGFNPPITMLNQSMPLGINSTLKGLTANEVQFAGSMLNPGIRIPIELATNRNLFYRSSLEPDPRSGNATTPAPAWAIEFGKVSPEFRRAAGLTEKKDKQGNWRWEWRKKADYLNSIPPGAIRLPFQYGKAENQRGLSQVDTWLRFSTGLRFDKSDAPSARITNLYDELGKADKRLQILTNSREQGGSEWRQLQAKRVALGAAIVRQSWKTGDVKLNDPANLIPKYLKGRRLTAEQLNGVLIRAQYRHRLALAGGSQRSGSSTPQVPSISSYLPTPPGG